ncbi:hypothetical protein TNCV_1093421 [Trichonephila clavipes]|nr:hypothetical protein TNCV_1093421 [Trichonephila clavipes]
MFRLAIACSDEIPLLFLLLSCCQGQSLRQVGLLSDRWRHHLSPPALFRHRTGMEENILQFPATVVSAITAHKTFGSTVLASTYSEDIRWHRTPNPGSPVWSLMF